jgi:hypothetical protein
MTERKNLLFFVVVFIVGEGGVFESIVFCRVAAGIAYCYAIWLIYRGRSTVTTKLISIRLMYDNKEQ